MQSCVGLLRLSAAHGRRRLLSSHAHEATALTYSEQGDPQKVLYLHTADLPPIQSHEVLLKMLSSPINPADINMIQGVYPVRPPLPAVGGNEGVGEVVQVGEGVKDFSVGQWVVPGMSGWGTWRTSAVAAEKDLIHVPKDVPLATLCTMAVSTCTAYRMLKDFKDLKPGDTVIQNGGNSAVGKALIQLAKHFGLTTINIVRDRPNIDELVAELTDLGASHVVTDVFVRSPAMKDLMRELPQPKLACNCVGGKATADLAKYLAEQGTMVTYGGMSKQPLIVPAGPLIFRDVKLKGFWMTKWNSVHSQHRRQAMWDELCGLARDGVLQAPKHRMLPLEDFKEAVTKSMDSFTNEKQIFSLNEPSS